MSIDPAHRRMLAAVARESISTGLSSSTPLAVDPAAHPEALRAPRASFVTLYRSGELRGCVGALEACRPLVADVAHNAYGAAFRDPRFPALAPAEAQGLELHISVLTALEPIPAPSRERILEELRPAVDGLLLELDGLRATFLPAVWDSLPDPRDFLEALERKARLPDDAWSRGLACSRYTAESWIG